MRAKPIEFMKTYLVGRMILPISNFPNDWYEPKKPNAPVIYGQWVYRTFPIVQETMQFRANEALIAGLSFQYIDNDSWGPLTGQLSL